MNTTVADRGLTVRQQIIRQLLDILKNMQDHGNPVWHTVYSGDITDLENNTAPFCTLNEGSEDTIEMYGGCTIKELPIIMSFRFRAYKGIDVLDQYKYYLGLLQHTFLPIHEDDQNYPLIRDIREEANTHTSLGQDDAQPGGDLVLILQYSHARNDPYRRAGE
jgi:hypothetical protein